MRAHLRYLGHYFRWRYLVAYAGSHTGAPVWRLLTLDGARLLPSVWFPFARYLYGPTADAQRWMERHLRRERGVGILDATAADEEWVKTEYNAVRKQVLERFQRARLRLSHQSPQSWTYYVLRDENKPTADALEMPEGLARVLVAEWLASVRDQTGKWDAPGTRRWYAQHRENLKLHARTRKLVEQVLGEARLGQ